MADPLLAERSVHQAGVIARQSRGLFHRRPGPSSRRFWLRLRQAGIDELLHRTPFAVAAPCGFAKAARFARARWAESSEAPAGRCRQGWGG